MNSTTPTCYRCDAEPTTRDHVPPRCIFPENMRIELITVPSCKEHNNNESAGDEYIRNLATMNFQSSTVGLNEFEGKALRALKRGNQKFVASKAIMVDPSTGIRREAYALEVDQDKVIAALTKIAWGLHYHCTGRRCESDPTVISLLTYNADENLRNNVEKAYQTLIEGLSASPWEGKNDGVFKYKFKTFEAGHLALAHFYGAPAFLAHYKATP